MSYAFSGQHETHKNKITERIIITVFNVSSDAGVFPPVGILNKKSNNFS